ncbi:MAG TPA: hypothetical protein VNL97_04410 [Solirubrobacterales bacterium]|nr:hypothetical protein [Solirubrobacterales bacterium]
MSPGLLSAGLGSVPAAQTYLDISQGNRVFDSLYDEDLPPHIQGKICGPAFSRTVVERAESAPADIEPGLLGLTLRQAGEECRVESLTLEQLAETVRALRGDDLLIAIERAPPQENHALAIGIAGRGYDGNLTSDSTRLDGYVLSTDVAPTILRWLGAAVPSAMSGQPIRAEGKVDPAAVESLGARMAVISERRGPVIGLSLLIWLVALGLAVAMTRGRAARVGIKLVGLSVVYLPLVLLLGAALEPAQDVELGILLLGAPALAVLTAFLFQGYRALAIAAATVVVAYAIDAIASSPLTTLSLLGPNPALGVRFYGIGNELEALLAVLVAAGTGAAIAGFAPRLSAGRCAVAFLSVGLIAAAIFAAGRFGADVGAAIVFPIGAATAAAIVARRRAAFLVIAAPLAVLALITFADLVSGANAHLTRSVLDAGGLDDLADVAQRRLRLSAHSFTRPVVLFFLPLVAALAIVAVVRRDQLDRWLRGYPAMRAGLLGAVAATLVGTLANDSGALLLEIGAAYLLAFLGFAWSEKSARDRAEPTREIDYPC